MINGQGSILEDPGDRAEEVTIPVFYLSLELCNTIRVVAEDNPIEVNLGFRCDIPEYGPEVIWGAEPGQGDFDGGLNGWTVVSEMDTSWAWTEDPIITGAFTNVAIEGTSCNGFMSFPSDNYETQFHNLICRAPCTGSLFSPTIDLTNHQIDGLFVSFWHQWRVFTRTNTVLIVSYDDGVSWPDSLVISSDPYSELPSQNPDCLFRTTPVNTGGKGNLVIPLENYNGQASVKLQFRHIGNYYYASIDDVRLINGSYFDIELDNTSYSQAPATAIPRSMVQPIPLQVDVDNLGNITATDITIRATARTPNGDVDNSFINDAYLDRPPYCYMDENNIFEEVYIPSPILGLHTVDYDNTTPGDSFPDNDNIQFTFEVTDSKWLSVDRPEPGTGDPRADGEFRNMWTGLPANFPTHPGFDWGLAYTFFVPETPYNQCLNTVRFGVNDKPGIAGDVKIYLYEWNPEEGSSLDPDRLVGDYSITPDDLQLVGVMSENVFGQNVNWQPLTASLSGAFDMTDITVKIGAADPLTGTPRLGVGGHFIPLELTDNQMYALVFVYNTEQEEELEMLANNADSGPYDLAPYNIAMDSLYLNGKIDKIIRTGATVTTDANPFVARGDFETELQEYVWDAGYWTTNQPWIEMNFFLKIGSTEELSSELAASIDVFPNPVSDVLNINVNLNQTTELVTFELMNVTGELVKVRRESNVSTGTYQMDVGDLTSGVYTLNVRTESKFTSKKVVISE